MEVDEEIFNVRSSRSIVDYDNLKKLKKDRITNDDSMHFINVDEASNTEEVKIGSNEQNSKASTQEHLTINLNDNM